MLLCFRSVLDPAIKNTSSFISSGVERMVQWPSFMSSNTNKIQYLVDVFNFSIVFIG